jgi:hypothetical protein
MNFDQYYEQVHRPEETAWKYKPHGWIQWKGTRVCMDVHCVCGAHGHIDDDFCYHYLCKACGRKFAVSAYVKMIELTAEQAVQVESAPNPTPYKVDDELAITGVATQID